MKTLTDIIHEGDNKPIYEAKAAREWSKIAQEPVTCEALGDLTYAFGSELACLRIFARFQGPAKTRIGFSKNRNTWYFSKENRF